MAAPIGNQNASGEHDVERPFRAALRRAIAQDDGKRIRETAEKLLDLAAAGEPWAVKELIDRTDGKPAQTIVGDPNSPLEMIHQIERTIVSLTDKDSESIPPLTLPLSI